MSWQRASAKLQRVLTPYSRVVPVEVTTRLREINPLVGQRHTYRWDSRWYRKHRSTLDETEDRLSWVYAVSPDLSGSKWIKVVVAPFHPDIMVRVRKPPHGGVTESMPLSEFAEEFREVLLQGAITHSFGVHIHTPDFQAATTVGDLVSASSLELPLLEPKPKSEPIYYDPHHNPYGN